MRHAAREHGAKGKARREEGRERRGGRGRGEGETGSQIMSGPLKEGEGGRERARMERAGAGRGTQGPTNSSLQMLINICRRSQTETHELHKEEEEEEEEEFFQNRTRAGARFLTRWD